MLPLSSLSHNPASPAMGEMSSNFACNIVLNLICQFVSPTSPNPYTVLFPFHFLPLPSLLATDVSGHNQIGAGNQEKAAHCLTESQR